MSLVHTTMSVLSDVSAPGAGMVDESTTSNLLASVRTFLGPVLLLIVAVVSLTFIFKRQTTQLVQFLGLTVVVAILFFSTDIIPAIADFVAGWFGAGSSGSIAAD